MNTDQGDHIIPFNLDEQYYYAFIFYENLTDYIYVAGPKHLIELLPKYIDQLNNYYISANKNDHNKHILYCIKISDSILALFNTMIQIITNTLLNKYTDTNNNITEKLGVDLTTFEINKLHTALNQPLSKKILKQNGLLYEDYMMNYGDLQALCTCLFSSVIVDDFCDTID